MTPKAQRIAIAEACGWTIHGSRFRVFGNPDDPCSNVSACHDLYGFPKTGGDDWVPDYLRDLNAMHEAEKVLTENQCDVYEVELRRILPSIRVTVGAPFYIWHATDAQRAEAFLRILNLWKDSK